MTAADYKAYWMHLRELYAVAIARGHEELAESLKPKMAHAQYQTWIAKMAELERKPNA